MGFLHYEWENMKEILTIWSENIVNTISNKYISYGAFESFYYSRL